MKKLILPLALFFAMTPFIVNAQSAPEKTKKEGYVRFAEKKIAKMESQGITITAEQKSKIQANAKAEFLKYEEKGKKVKDLSKKEKRDLNKNVMKKVLTREQLTTLQEKKGKK